MQKLNIAEAVIFSIRADVRNAVRQELKACDVKPDNMHNVQTAQQCLEKMRELKAVFLVLDWEVGPDKVLEVLQANRGEHRVESCPTFLIAARLDEHITSAATEYNVSQVHAGEISPGIIKSFIKELVRDANQLTPMRQILVSVEKCRAEGKYEESVEILKKVQEKNPENTRIAMELAESYIQCGKWDPAQVILEDLKEADPPLARARHLLSKCYLKKGNHQKAIEAMRDAQLANPYNVERLLELGNIFLDIERPKDAKAAFDDILSFAPDSKKAKLSKSTSMLALGELNEALAILKGSANNRELASVFNTSAILAIRQGKHESGLELYKTAANAIGNNPKILSRLMFNMGIGYVKWGKTPEAIRCFEESAKLDPTFQEASHNMTALKKGKPAPQPGAAAPAKKKAPAVPKAEEFSGMEEAIGGELNIEKGGGTLSFNHDLSDDDLDL